MTKTSANNSNSSETLTRASIADAVYQEIGLSHADSSKLVDDVLEEVILAMEQDGSIKVARFGSFEVRQKNQREGRNPKTKKSAVITKRKVVSFYASNILKKRINDQMSGQ